MGRRKTILTFYPLKQISGIILRFEGSRRFRCDRIFSRKVAYVEKSISLLQGDKHFGTHDELPYEGCLVQK